MRLVQMVTTIDDVEITYAVIDGDATCGDFVNGASTVWTKTVRFGATDATVAGGIAFVLAAREQEVVAMRLRSMTEAEVTEVIRNARTQTARADDKRGGE